MSIYTGQTRRGTPESEGCWRDPVTGRRGRPCVEGVEERDGWTSPIFDV